MLYWQVMTRDDTTRRWFQRADAWRDRMADLGLDGLLPSLTHVAHPLGALGAQVLWLAEGALGPLDGGLAEEAGALATLLDDPAAFEHLLARLATDSANAAETG